MWPSCSGENLTAAVKIQEADEAGGSIYTQFILAPDGTTTLDY
jgi:hypothetical protein